MQYMPKIWVGEDKQAMKNIQCLNYGLEVNRNAVDILNIRLTQEAIHMETVNGCAHPASKVGG